MQLLQLTMVLNPAVVAIEPRLLHRATPELSIIAGDHRFCINKEREKKLTEQVFGREMEISKNEQALFSLEQHEQNEEKGATGTTAPLPFLDLSIKHSHHSLIIMMMMNFYFSQQTSKKRWFCNIKLQKSTSKNGKGLWLFAGSATAHPVEKIFFAGCAHHHLVLLVAQHHRDRKTGMKKLVYSLYRRNVDNHVAREPKEIFAINKILYLGKILHLGHFAPPLPFDRQKCTCPRSQSLQYRPC